MSCHRPFCRMISLALPAIAALVLLTPAQLLPARAQGAQATLSDSAKSDAAKPPAPPAAGANVAAVDAANPQQKSVTSKAIEKVKEVAKSAGDIFSRVPCLPPKGGARKMVLAAARGEQARRRRAGPDHRVRFFFDAGPWLDVARIHLSQPAGGAAAPAISDRRHHRGQPRQGRRGRARNDEAAADRGDRHASRIW